ncbi:MAG: inorganic pyrophosphatase [Abditibacteriota bacterium]|nr:inorganic pyrophosphatase [Abditibacteriota bacterium]
MHISPPTHLRTFDLQSGELNVVIETPKGSRNKFDYDEEQGVFKLGGVLPVGASFPFDFGFAPSTLGEDGDPLDVLVLMDEPAFAGCLVPSRLLGAIEAEQTERDGHSERNDRLIAVASNYRQHQNLSSLNDLNPTLMDEIEHFFASYNLIKGKQFKTMARSGPERALQLIDAGQLLFDKRNKRKSSGRKA